ncbi:MAG: zf-HC2 domain-containing protein [Candidatus Acidiferrales bacterium]
MNCSDIAELAPLFLSAELDRQRAAAFDAHLKSCPACMQELERQARLDAELREAVAWEPVDAGSVDRRVRERISAEAGGSARPAPLHRRWVIAVIGAAAALLLVGAGYRGLLGPRVARVYADAAMDHRLEVVQKAPRPWKVDPSDVAALAETQGVPMSVPVALSSGAYHLERAKLCFLDGRMFLHLVYSDGTQEFSVYLRQRAAESLPGRARETDNGRVLHTSNPGNEHVASFQTDLLTVMVVTDQSADTALRFARFAATAL